MCLARNRGDSIVSQLEGKLFYSSYNPRTTLLEDFFCETYDKALEIVNDEKCFNVDEQSKLLNQLEFL